MAHPDADLDPDAGHRECAGRRVVLAVWWLLAAATSDSYFAVANAVATSWFGDLVFTGSLWAVWYHYLAGCGTFTMTPARGWTFRRRKSWAGPACRVGRADRDHQFCWFSKGADMRYLTARNAPRARAPRTAEPITTGR